MRPAVLFPLGGALALVGLVLLVVETARALSGNALGTPATVAMWVGVGLVVAGGVLLLISVSRTDDVELDGGQPADG